jgi:hypothetical protein
MALATALSAVSASAKRRAVLRSTFSSRAIARMPRPRAVRAWTAACWLRIRASSRDSGAATAMVAGSGPGWGSWDPVAAAICLRQARCRATALTVCPARLCHKCQRSATCTAAGAPARAPSNGGAGPVPADHPGAWVGLQPVRQRAGVPASQHVDRPPCPGVDQDGPVDMPAAQREIIDPHDLRPGGARARR